MLEDKEFEEKQNKKGTEKITRLGNMFIVTAFRWSRGNSKHSIVCRI